MVFVLQLESDCQETWKSQQTQCSLQATGYENPILFESTLTNDKIALKYTILFLFMDVGLTPVFFIVKKYA